MAFTTGRGAETSDTCVGWRPLPSEVPREDSAPFGGTQRRFRAPRRDGSEFGPTSREARGQAIPLLAEARGRAGQAGEVAGMGGVV